MSHYFKFSINWRAGKRLCGECGMTYSAGSHILIDKLKPYTSYVCPSGGGTGHSSRYTGAYDMGELRSPTDHVCICGLDLVEEDNESWLLSYETRPATGQKWQPVSITRSKHAAHQQLEGLLALIDQGEQIPQRLIAAEPIMNADPQLMAYLYGVPLWFYEAMIARWEADRIRS